MMLSHRCRSCSHLDFYHSVAPDCSYGGCVCPSPDFDPEPEHLPTFDRGGQKVLTYLPPGWRGGQNDLRPCACERCVEVARELVTAAP